MSNKFGKWSKLKKIPKESKGESVKTWLAKSQAPVNVNCESSNVVEPIDQVLIVKVNQNDDVTVDESVRKVVVEVKNWNECESTKKCESVNYNEYNSQPLWLTTM